MNTISKQLSDVENLKTLVVDLLAKAKTLGADQAEISASNQTGFSVNVRMGEVETLEHHREKGIAITVYFGQRLGVASTSDLSAQALQATLEKACSIARFTGEDNCSGLANPQLMAYHYPDLDLCHRWQITPEQAIELAKNCEAMALAGNKLITNSDGVSVTNSAYFQVYANSHGFLGAYPSSLHSMSCGLIAFDGQEMQRDYEYTKARDANDLMKIEELARRAVRRTVSRLAARRLTTQYAPVIFAADVAKSLLGSFVGAIMGSNLYRKASFLFDHLHKPVFPKHIQIDERPHLLKGIGSTPYDSEGVATQARTFVKDGELTSYILSSYSARKLGLPTTGNADGIHNLFIKTDAIDFEQLLKKMDRGLLVTELIGQGVNLVTGDYSRGIFGYWVERGEIQFPVHEVTIAGNLKDMLLNIISVANDIDDRGNIRTGSILIEKMMIAGE